MRSLLRYFGFIVVKTTKSVSFMRLLRYLYIMYVVTKIIFSFQISYSSIQAMDLDKNNYLSAHELKIFMSRLGDQMTDEEAEDMVRRMMRPVFISRILLLVFLFVGRHIRCKWRR